MNPSVKAILARCGSISAAIDYCTEMAYKYPRLGHEYLNYRDALIHGGHQKAEGATA